MQSGSTTALPDNKCVFIEYYGMSMVQANADKLTFEVEEFGYPPVFPKKIIDAGSLIEEVTDPIDPTKRVKKTKSKVLAKSSSLTFQWQIMESIGMKDSEIKQCVYYYVA